MGRSRFLTFVIFAAVAVAIVSPAASVTQTPQFRAGVDVVELNVAVIDGKKPVADLKAADFEVLDNGVKQPILSVTREVLPIDVTMVVDVSESVNEPLLRSILSAVNRIRERLKPEDRVSLLTFNHRVTERVELLPPPAVRAVDIGRPAGQTSLNDAIGVALAQKHASDRRQMIIVFTDGFDSSSLLTEDDVYEIAGRSPASVFPVARESGVTMTSPDKTATVSGGGSGGRQPRPFFGRLAEVTGGVAQLVPAFNLVRGTNLTTGADEMRFARNDTLLDEPFIKALDDFRSSYVLRYNLTGVPRGGWHAVTVRVIKAGKKYVVRTRTGYGSGTESP